jgi:DNA helicase-2/ATP-dependent DNA helicase PcrA
MPNSVNLTLRPSQISILRYHGGKMGISAVPGSGKTFTLSALAAQIITNGSLAPDQDVLIVTLVNSAVDNFASRIGKLVEQRGLIPHLGYRVRTLHGLAHDIVREKPALAGLEERFQIIDEREAEFIRKEAARAWLNTNAETLIAHYFKEDVSEQQINHLRSDEKFGLPAIIDSLAMAFIRSCKNRAVNPEDLRQQLQNATTPLPLAEAGWWIYEKYQQALRYRGAVDFDDLISLAWKILNADPDYLARLQYRFPYILEDEAQDSSEIQEKILRLLAGNPTPTSGRGWVRVGDPNQAIFETFTTANPQLLKDFISYEADKKEALPVSGRSQPYIIDLANALIDWVTASHPEPACRDALTVPYIQATAANDPQPNPAPDAKGIRLVAKKHSPEEEIEAVVKSLQKWLPNHSNWTVAVLVPRNTRGMEVIEALKKRKIDYIEFLSSTSNTRATAGAIANVIAYLSDPASASKLAKAYQVWRRAWREDETQRQKYILCAELLRKVGKIEEYLFPAAETPGMWLKSIAESESEEVLTELEAFRDVARRWQGTTLLPIDQMILTLAQELFSEPADLALAHKLALVLRRAADEHSSWRLPELTAELGVIAKNERKFIGFSADDAGFDPERHRGKVVVTTMHKAKGLEWDRVYLMSVNNYDFPSLQSYDRYISEKWFIRNGLNLEAEALAQLKALFASDSYEWYEEGAASLRARLDYTRERLRLLYVGITRAKRDLVLTWNSGRQGDSQRCLPVEALVGWWQSQSKEA